MELQNRCPCPRSAPRSAEHVVVGLPRLSRSSGKMGFELDVLSAEGQLFVGFAGSNFRGDNVGADETSWAVTQDWFGRGHGRHK